MARYRQTERRWVHAACVAGAYLVLVASLFTLQLGAGLNLPVSVAVATPPLVYAALAVVLLREASFVRRLAWVGSACVVHVLLGALAATELTWGGGLSLPAALAQVFVLFPPAPALTLVATPLTLAAFGLTAARPARRADAAPRPATPARPKPFSPPASVAKAVPEAAVRTAPPTHVAPPLGSSPAAPPAPSVARAPLPATSAAPAPVVAVPTAPLTVVAAASAAPPADRAPKPARRADDGMVRVSFARIAAQLPADAFVLPFERLGEGLREPNMVLVPRRVVLSQLRDGTAAITWAHIASQFPDLALGVSADEFRKQYPDLKLWLPMDEVMPQLPPEAIAGAPAPELDRLASGPAPLTAPPTTFTPAPIAPRPVLAAPAPPEPASPREELMDREVLSRIVACFTGIRSFEATAHKLAGSAAVMLVEPTVPRAALTACAERLLRCVAGAAGDVVTARTEHAVLVLAIAPTPIVVAARLPGTPVALLVLCALRAAAAVGDGALALPSPPRRALEPVSVDGRVSEAAQALRSLGVVEPTVFAEGPARVYVFSARRGDDKAVGALALNLCDALGDGADLGRPRAVVVRRGDEHTLVRPLAGGAGVLAATGPVTRPGRLIREADRAAKVLEAI